jgi:hypothetical protein
MANPLELLHTLRQLLATPGMAPAVYQAAGGQAGPPPPEQFPPAPQDGAGGARGIDVREGLAALPLPPPAPPGEARRSPTVTPGIAGSTPAQAAPAPAEVQQPATQQDTLQQIQALREGTGAPSNDGAGRDLATFGFGMAASRNPSLFGQIGEAGLAMMRGRREDRQDTNAERTLSVQEAFQQARIRLQEAEQAFAADPANPANAARLAQARYYEAMAARAARGGGEGGGGGGDGRVVAREVGNDGNVYNVFRDGSVRPATLPDGTPFQRGGNPDQMDARILAARQRALQELSLDPTFAIRPPGQQAPLIEQRTRDILANMQGANTVRQQRTGGGAAPNVAVGDPGAPVTPRVRVDVTGRPIN